MSTAKNRVQLIGHLGTDPEVKNLSTGTKVAQMRMATNERYKTSQGTWKENTQWHRISAWEKLAERAEQQLHKGSYVMVEGRLVHSEYVDGQGIKHYITEVRAANLVLLEKRGQQPESVSTTAVLADQEDEEDGLPF